MLSVFLCVSSVVWLPPLLWIPPVVLQLGGGLARGQAVTTVAVKTNVSIVAIGGGARAIVVACVPPLLFFSHLLSSTSQAPDCGGNPHCMPSTLAHL